MSDDPAKDALSMIPYGFFGISSRDGEDVNIMVANWVSQMSFSPRIVAIGLQKTAYSHGVIARGGVFAVNIFNAEDAEALKPYMKGRSKNPDKVKDGDFSLSPNVKCPVVAGAAAYLECKLVKIVDVGGDHDIVVGEVIGAGVMKAGDAADTLSLAQLGWNYAG